jgi:hypothetical protein
VLNQVSVLREFKSLSRAVSAHSVLTWNFRCWAFDFRVQAELADQRCSIFNSSDFRFVLGFLDFGPVHECCRTNQSLRTLRTQSRFSAWLCRRLALPRRSVFEAMSQVRIFSLPSGLLTSSWNPLPALIFAAPAVRLGRG